MKFLIPHVGFIFTLTNDLSAKITVEKRNNSLIKSALGKDALKDKPNHVSVQIPKGTVLSVDRVYIRKGIGADFNSITFVVKSSPSAAFAKQRFFISLADVHLIEFVEIESKPVGKTYADVMKDLSAINREIVQNYKGNGERPNSIRALIGERKPFYSFSKPSTVEQVLSYALKSFTNIKALLSNYLQENLTAAEKKQCGDFYFKETLKERVAMPFNFTSEFLKDQRQAKIICLTMLVKLLRDAIEKADNRLENISTEDKKVAFSLDCHFYDYEGHVVIERKVLASDDSIKTIHSIFDIVHTKKYDAELVDYSRRLLSNFFFSAARLQLESGRSIVQSLINLDLRECIYRDSDICFKNSSTTYSQVLGDGESLVIDCNGDSIPLRKAILNISATMKSANQAIVV